MKKNSLIFFLLFSIKIFSQSINDDCKTLSKIKTLLQENHYRPKPVNDSLSVYVFSTFLEKLDQNNSLFLESEINSLKKHRLKIDNYINDTNCVFLDDFFFIYSKAVNRYNSIITAITKENFPLSSKELIYFYSKSKPYLKSEIELKNLYKKRMLMDVLLDVSRVSKNKDSLIKVFDKVALVSKTKVFDTYSCKGNKYSMSLTEFNEKFFNVFCSYFDPHTEYFSQNDKSSFLSTVSSDNLTFGMLPSLDVNNDITIQEIIPGSSAFFSKKIEKGDQIIKIISQGEEIIVGCTNLEKLEKFFASNDYKIADFYFRKKNGEKYSVSLIKKVMKDYQNSVFSFILEKDTKKMGYIKIPSFYTETENGKTNMSDDVMREILKLQEEKIGGLIIDLENNGGGSMYEAIKLCGFFINESAVAIERNRFNKDFIINKQNKKLYSGPVIILINGLSASASEFFTNAMQDYNLAIVMGTKSLGKATIQQIIPLENESNQFVKATLGQFYRITGKSNQYIGISPTIEIPSLFQNQYLKESSFPTAIKNDLIKSSITFNTYSMSEDHKKMIAQFNLSLKTDKEIQKIKSLNIQIDQLYKNPYSSISLNFNSVFDKMNSLNNLWSEIKKSNETVYPFVVSNTKFDTQHIKFDDYLQTVNQNNIKLVNSNFLIFESVKMMSDLNK